MKKDDLEDYQFVTYFMFIMMGVGFFVMLLM